MSQVFLINVSDDKQGVCYPDIVGPFPDEEAARAFAQQYAFGTDRGGAGGYHDYHVISEDTATPPEQYAEDHAWLLEEDEEVEASEEVDPERREIDITLLEIAQAAVAAHPAVEGS